MTPRIVKQRTGCFFVGFILSFLLCVPISQATEFYLSVAGGNGKEHCEFLEIRENKAVCTEKNIVMSYDLGLIQGVEIVDDERIQFISKLTPDLIARINSSNRRAQEYKETVAKIGQTEIGYLFHEVKHIKSFADCQYLARKQYQKYGLNGLLHLFLPLLGTCLVFIGSLWFIIAAFRVHILWGTGCIVLPFVTLFFLFLHWRAAAKPFTLTILGGILAFSGVYLFEEKKERSVREQAADFMKKVTRKQEQSRFTCQGKKYCSQMTSCEEATFYLQNCPGTKIDGDRDGIPCEGQWCK